MRAGSSLSHTRAKWSRSIWREGFYASPLNFLLVLCCEPARRLMFALFLCLLSSFLSGFVLLCNCVRIPWKLTVGLKNQVKPCVSFIAESVSWKHTRELRIVWILLKYWASQVTEVMRSELFLMLPANSKTRDPLDTFRDTLCALLKSRSKCFANIQWMNIIHIQPVYIWIDMFEK